MINFYKTLINNTSNNKIVNDLIGYHDCKTNIITKCPYCESKKVIKYGMYKNIQRYKCKDSMCGKTFTNEFYNQFRCSKKFKEKYQEYFTLLNNGFTIRECANKLNITVVTAFFWRHRFLFDFKNKHYLENISSYVELTKMIVVENFKGSRNIPNIKRDKITVVNALNDSIDIIPIIAARNFFGFYELRDNIIPRLNKKAYVVGLIDGRLKTFANAFNEINKVKFKENYKNNIDIQYSINTQKWLSKFRGVASKYLDHYLYWRLFEYKNNFNSKRNISSKESIKKNLHLTADITTYVSWKSIKSKTLPI
ncbi:MAG: hypothetical protein U0L64_05880 [Clostridium sp.]|nr:hypothetical protein [Clostridium sp.]